MIRPIRNKKAVMTSGYGHRTLPNGSTEFHGGIDIAVHGNPVGVPVYSTCAGTIGAIITDASISCGRAVFIKREGADYYCLYMHLETVNADLSVGDYIPQATYLGTMGNTGASRGMHLHYGHRKSMVSGSETYDPVEVSALYK